MAHPRRHRPLRPPAWPPSIRQSPGRSPCRTRRTTTRPLAPVLSCALVQLGQFPVGRKAGNREVDRAVLSFICDALARAGPAPARSSARMNPVARGYSSASWIRSHLRSSWNAAANGAVKCPDATPFADASRMIRSSTSVRFMIWKTLKPLAIEPATQQILEEEGPEVPDVGVVPDRRAAGVQRGPARHGSARRVPPAGERVVEAEGHGAELSRADVGAPVSTAAAPGIPVARLSRGELRSDRAALTQRPLRAPCVGNAEIHAARGERGLDALLVSRRQRCDDGTPAPRPTAAPAWVRNRVRIVIWLSVQRVDCRPLQDRRRTSRSTARPCEALRLVAKDRPAPGPHRCHTPPRRPPPPATICESCCSRC